MHPTTNDNDGTTPTSHPGNFDDTIRRIHSPTMSSAIVTLSSAPSMLTSPSSTWRCSFYTQLDGCGQQLHRHHEGSAVLDTATNDKCDGDWNGWILPMNDFLGLVAPGNNYKFDWECHLHGLGECCRKRYCCDFFASRRTVILWESEKEERFKMQVQPEGRWENFCGFCCQQYNLPCMIGTEPAVPSLVDVWLTRLCIAVLRPLCVPFCSCGKKILMYLDRFGRVNLSHNHASFLSSNQSTSSIIMNANHSCLS